MDDLKSFIESHGFSFEPVELDNSWHDVLCEKTNKKIAYIGGKTADGKTFFTFKSWQTPDEKYTFKNSDAPVLSKEEKQKLKKEKELLHEKISKTAYDLFQTAKNNPPDTNLLKNNYLSKKGFSPLGVGFLVEHAFEIDSSKDPLLLVPLKDTTGKIWNIQYIQKSGAKTFLPKAKTQGLFTLIDIVGPSPSDTLYLCEGLATSLSVSLAMGAQTLCAFGLGNIPHVLKELKKAKWQKQFIVVLDNDHEKKVNAGLTQLEKLKKQFPHIKYVYPKIVGPGESDYNDIHLSKGLEAVKSDITEQVLAQTSSDIFSLANEILTTQDKIGEALTSISTPGETQKPSVISEVPYYLQKYVNGVSVFPITYTDKGKPILPTEMQVADFLLKYYKDKLIRYEKCIFKYTGTHWEELSDKEETSLVTQCSVAYSGLAGSRKIADTIKLFKNLLNYSPQNLFSTNPYVANFLNGTLHINKKSKREYSFEFKPHAQSDFVTNVIPINYDETRSIRNQEWDDIVSRLLGGNADNVRMLKQMYGACLTPLFPRFFLLHGPSGYGKSSLIIPATLLVNEKNASQVGPTEIKGFLIESMINKLINFDTDIETNELLSDSIIKKIEDRIPLLINRKNKVAVRAPLPAIHIFGANDIPKTLEKSGAHKRRWSFIKVDHFDASNSSGKEKFIVNRIFEECPEAILNFALEGLEDLLKNGGDYFDSKASASQKDAWALDNDVVGRFLRDVRELGAEKLKIGEEYKIASSDLWLKFKAWHNKEEGQDPKITLNTLCKYLVNKGFQRGRTENFRYFCGLGENSKLGILVENNSEMGSF